MIRKIALILLLFGASLASAADLYVNPATGLNTNPGTLAEPKKSLANGASNALATAATGDTIWLMAGTYDAATQYSGNPWYINFATSDMVVTVRPYGGASIVLQTNDGSYCVRMNGTDPNSSIEFRDITFAPTTTPPVIKYGNAVTGTVKMVNCTITAGSGNIINAGTETIPTKRIILENCTASSSHATPFYLADADLLSIDGGTYTIGGAAGPSFQYLVYVRNTVVKNATFNAVMGEFFNPTGLDKFDVIHFSGNTINVEPTGPQMSGFTLPTTIDYGSITIENNIITKTGVEGYRPIRFGAYSSWSSYKCKGVRIIGNTINLQEDDNSTAITLGPNADNAVVIGNTCLGGACGIASQGRGNLIMGNKVHSHDPFILFGLSDSIVANNTLVADGETNSRAMVLGRQAWFGGSLSEGNTSTTFANTTVTFGGTPDLSIPLAALAAGWDVIAYTCDGYVGDAPAAGSVVRWGTVPSGGINDATDVVTVDDWKLFGGSAAPANPANGTRAWLVTFPRRNTVINNIFDSTAATYVVTFDYVPFNPEHLYDYNLYAGGTDFFSNLGEQHSADVGNLSLTFASYKEKWAVMQSGFTENDANSFNLDPLLASPSTGNFTVSVVSPAIGNASDGGTIGAWQPPVGRRQGIIHVR